MYSLDLPASIAPVWDKLGTGLPTAPVWDMEYDVTDNVLVVGTLGRGAWTLQFEGNCGLVDDLLLRNKVINSSQTHKACSNIYAGEKMQVAGGGVELQLTAGNSIRLLPGFYVGNGADLKTRINPLVGP